MSLEIIYGRAGTGKTTYCFNKIAQEINKEKKIYIITPEQFSYTAEKKLMDTINKKAVCNVEVVTLSRMAYRVLSQLGKANETKLTKSGKAMLIYSILKNNKNKLNWIGKSDENIEIAMSAITELKKHGITLENLKKEIEQSKEIELKTKLEDITLLYENFEKHIQNKYIEETDSLTILANNIELVDYLEESIIYIDEFSGFTKQELDVIIGFIKNAKKVNITVCTDSLQKEKNPDVDIFYSNKTTIEKIQKRIKEENIKIKISSINLFKNQKFITKELEHLEKNIYEVKQVKFEGKVENIKLFLAKNQYTEIEHVAKQINNLVRKENLRYNQIAIITRDIPKYSGVIKSIFSKYEIPVFIDEKRDLNQNGIIQYFLSILEVFQKNFSREAVFSYIKTGFLNLDEQEIFLLENYCNKWGIQYNKWRQDFNYEKQENQNVKEKEKQLNQYRKQIIEPLLSLKNDFLNTQVITQEEKIKQIQTAKTITLAMYNFLREQQIEEKWKEKIKELEKNSLLDLVQEYIASYNVLIELLDEIILVFQDDKMSIEDYIKILKIGLKNSGLGKIPGTMDQVIVGDIERTRSHKIDTTFIIGLNDGVFPSVRKEEGFLNDEDRNYLKLKGIELANGTLEQLYEENFNIYKAFSTAEKRLYISYLSSDTEGKSLRPSMLINKIKRMYPNLKEESDIIEKKYNITNLMGTYEDLLENISNVKNGNNINSIWYKIYKYYQKNNNWSNKLKKDLRGLHYTNIPEKIEQKNIDNLYGNILKTSVSRLEKYRSCPFSYYLQYGLNLKERQELKVKNFQTGSFMHELIDEFFTQSRQEKIDLEEFLENPKYIEEKVDRIIDEKLKLDKNYIFISTSKYLLLVRRLKRIVTKALKYMIESLVESDFELAGTEITFKEKGEYPPIYFSLENGKKIEITGTIDRMDIAKTSEGNYLRIIDYKSSARNIDFNEVYAGIQIQLLTYLDAVCKKEDLIPAGILYFGLIEQMIKADKKISSEDLEEQIRQNFRMKGLILADVKVIKMQDTTLNSGSSKKIPAALTTKGEINKSRTSGIEKEDFLTLQNYIEKTIKQISKEIWSGNIELKPYNKKGITPCRYCPYKVICGFDNANCENNYRYIGKKSKEEILEKMKEDIWKI